jgi:hypothetical protein
MLILTGMLALLGVGTRAVTRKRIG